MSSIAAGLYLLSALVLLGSPGPGIAALLAVGRLRGFAGGLRFFAGLQMGLAAVAALCASGLLSILTALPGLAQSLTICACAYLARLAWVIAAAPIGGGAKADAVAPTFTAGLLLGLSNPKAYLAFVTLFASQTIAAGSTRADATLKWGLIVLVIFAVDVAWLYAGARLGRVPVSARAERSINVVLGLGILAVSVHSLLGLVG